jgi:hypothetical protein
MSIRLNARTAVIAALAVAVAVLLTMLLFPGKGTTAGATPGALIRIASDYDFNSESSTTASSGSGGSVIYNRDVSVPANANTLYVIFSGTGDQHSDSSTLLNCYVDNVACGGDEWVNLQNTNGEDNHDNSIHYTWCKAIAPGKPSRHVELKLASSGGDTVYVEQMSFYVDAAFTPHGCTNLDPGSPTGPATGHGG